MAPVMAMRIPTNLRGKELSSEQETRPEEGREDPERLAECRHPMPGGAGEADELASLR